MFSLASPVSGQCPTLFTRGDVDGSGEIDISDPVLLLGALFVGEYVIPCDDAADSNDDGMLNISDPVFALNFLFTGSTSFPQPFEACGLDPTEDTLGCETFNICRRLAETDTTCDGIDDDCDGVIDDDVDFDNELLNCGECGNDCSSIGGDRVLAYVCLLGRCTVAECEEGWYDGDGIAENGCETQRPPNNTPCDDGNPCTSNDRYLFALCGGVPRDCSEFADACNYGVCDVETGECIRVPRPNRPCDDGNPDTINDRCNSRGTCSGTALPAR